MATHSSILAWRIPWIEDPGRLESVGLQRVGHNWSDWTCTQAGMAEEGDYMTWPWRSEVFASHRRLGCPSAAPLRCLILVVPSRMAFHCCFPSASLSGDNVEFLPAQDVGRLGAALPGTVLSAAGIGPQLFPAEQWPLFLARKGSSWKEHFFGCSRALRPPRLREMNCSFFLPQVGVPWLWMAPLWTGHTGKCGLAKEGILGGGLSEWHLPRHISSNTYWIYRLLCFRGEKKLLTMTERTQQSEMVDLRAWDWWADSENFTSGYSYAQLSLWEENDEFLCFFFQMRTVNIR